MRGILATAAACIAIAASGASHAETSKLPMKMTLSGEGRWVVRCMFEVGNGNIDREEFRGKARGPVEFSNANMSHGTCDYKAAPDKPLMVSVEGEWACPLQSTAGAKCEQTVASGASGTFRFERRSQK